MTFAAPWSLENLTEGDVQFHYAGGGSHDGAPWLIVDVVDNVYADPCHTADGPLQPPVDHSASAVLAALSEMQSVTAGGVTNVQINGRPASKVKLTNSLDPDTTVCTGDHLLWMWTTSTGSDSPGTNGGATENIWAFDVADAVVLVDGETYINTPAAEKSLFESLAQTIVFD